MRAVTFDTFGGPLTIREVPVPALPDHGALVRVAATGVCRSDWHAWAGHDDSVGLPHVPGHEFAGAVAQVGPGVRRWRGGERVTAPFVNACGSCASCTAGRPTTCERQTQPGFDRWGSWAEYVVVDHADLNLVALPDALSDDAAAALGCRFATAYRAVRSLARVREAEIVAVYGCGGVGLSAVMVAAAYGAKVVAIDPSPAARERARALGAEVTAVPGPPRPQAGPGAPWGGDGLTDAPSPESVSAADAAHALDALGGAHVTIDALGRAAVTREAIAALRPGGRHVQIGLLLGADALPVVDLGRVVAKELTILGSHGMGAADYPQMLADIAAGLIDPAALVGRVERLQAAEATLRGMSEPAAYPGTTVLHP